MSPNESDWDTITAPIGPVPGVNLGFPGMPGVQVDSKDLALVVGPTRLGTTTHEIKGQIQVDSPGAIQQSFLGSPFNVSDNPLGIIPSTIFTPTAAKLLGIDPAWLQLLSIAAILGALVIAGSTSDRR